MLGGFSPNFTILLIARIIQALGSGIMMPHDDNHLEYI